MTLADFYKAYYGNKRIREIIKSQLEDALFCVGSGPALLAKNWAFPVKLVPKKKLDILLDEGLDIFRPVASTSESFYIFWDLEYYNRDDRGYIYRNQNQVFKKMQVIKDEINKIFDEYKIKYILDVTASGFHYWMKISKKSSVFKNFSESGFLSESIKEKYLDPDPEDLKKKEKISLQEAMAYDCAGKILEFVTHILRGRLRDFPLQITISDAPAGEMFEGFSSDITQYGHPMFMRVFRVIASLHQKNIMFHGGNLPAINAVWGRDDTLEDILERMWNYRKSLAFFENFNFELDFSDEGFSKLYEDYMKSSVSRIHREFENAPPEKIKIQEEPEEIRIFFEKERANPCLLDPFYLRKIISFYAKQGAQRVKGIMSLIARYYEDEAFNWYDPVKMRGIDWKKYDAKQAANFWGRVYFTQFILDNIAEPSGVLYPKMLDLKNPFRFGKK